MQIIRPGNAAQREHNVSSRHSWFDEWLKKFGKYTELTCGCIVDFNLPNCIELITGKTTYILCDKHNDFYAIKRSVKYQEVLKDRIGVDIDNNDDNAMLPPYLQTVTWRLHRDNKRSWKI
jgi:hypothetical protein